jgi:hypothetical protein
MRRRAALLTASALFAGCDREGAPPPSLGTRGQAVTIEDVAESTCDTPPELVNGLSRQLVDAINCLRPGTLADIPDGDVHMLRADRPAYVDARALEPLLDAAAEGDRPMVLKWAYRDVALQQLFWRQEQLQGCAVAAPPGLSNHQNGLAVDVTDADAIAYWGPHLRRHGWDNRLPNDTVHFDYQRADDVGLGTLSLYAFQALWNANHPDERLPLTGELDAATDAALTDAPIEGFDLDLCADGVPPVGTGPVRGPTVGQASWRGCDAPRELIDGLSWQIADAMDCLQPGALAPLRLCDGPGCLRVQAEPVPHWLGTPAHDALLGVSRDTGAPVVVRWAFRDVALQHFFAMSHTNIACPSAAAAGESDHNTGLAVNLPDADALSEALGSAGFTNQGTALAAIWRYAGPDADDLTSLNVLAFQELWNLNRPDDPIAADGLIGPQTRGAIARSPVDGFAHRMCEDREMPDAGAPDADAGVAAGDAGADDAGGEVDAGAPPGPDDVPDAARRPPRPRRDASPPGPDEPGDDDAGASLRDGGLGGPPSVERSASSDEGCAQVGGAGSPLALLLGALALRRRRRSGP